MYDTTYTATGISSSDTRVQAIGRPNFQPGRNQPSGAGAGGSSSRTGSSGDGGAASGPKPVRPATHRAPATTIARAISANADRTGVAVADPRWIVAFILPRASASSSTPIPAAPGAATAKRASSIDQAMGCRIVTSTVAIVRPIMISMNVRFAPLWPAGTVIAM